MSEFADHADPHVLVDGGRGFRKDETIVRGEEVGHEAVVGAGQFGLLGVLLVRVVVQQDVLLHPEVFPQSQLVEERDLLHLKKHQVIHLLFTFSIKLNSGTVAEW